MSSERVQLIYSNAVFAYRSVQQRQLSLEITCGTIHIARPISATKDGTIQDTQLSFHQISGIFGCGF